MVIHRILRRLIYQSIRAFCIAVVCAGSAYAQSTEIVTGTETTTNFLPSMGEFTTTGGTKTGSGSGSQRGCATGKFCTAGTQGPGGTYSTTFDLEEKMTIDDINRGFTMDYGVDVESHPSNSVLSSCVGGNVMQSSDCRDIFNLTLTLSQQNTVVHQFKHEVELDFTGVRSFDFSQIIPANSFSGLTGGFELFGIDAGFSSGFFGPRFAAPHLSTTFDIVTLVEAEVIDLITQEIETPVITTNPAPVVLAPASQPEPVAIAPIQIAEVQEISTVELAPPVVTAPATSEEATVSEGVVAEVEAEVEAQPEAQPETQPETQETQPDESQPAEPEPEDQPEDTPESTEERPAETREVKENKGAAEKQPKKAVVQKAKEKAGKKIMAKMNDKSRYDASNQIRTLAVMNVISTSNGIFKQQTALKDIQGFFQPTKIPDATLPQNNFAEYMLFGGSDAGHKALTATQYR